MDTAKLIRTLKANRATKTQAELAIMWQRDPRMAVAWQAAMLANGKRKLLSVNQAKLDKSGKTIGVLTVGLTMSPADEATPFITGRHAGRDLTIWEPTKKAPAYNACAGSTAACRAVCVGNATGQAAISAAMPFDGHRLARIGRSVLRHFCRDLFDARERSELASARRKADRLGYGLAYRPDVATDHQDGRKGSFHPVIGPRMPVDMNYGYSAVSAAMRRDDGTLRAFSRKDTERSDGLARAWVAKGYPVAVVFAVAKGEPLPKTWGMAPVIDGDLHDVWPMQDHPTTGEPISESYGQHGVVVGLRAKYATIAQRDTLISSGFAVAA